MICSLKSSETDGFSERLFFSGYSGTIWLLVVDSE